MSIFLAKLSLTALIFLAVLCLFERALNEGGHRIPESLGMTSAITALVAVLSGAASLLAAIWL